MYTLPQSLDKKKGCRYNEKYELAHTYMEEVPMSTSIFLEEREFLAHIHEIMVDENNSFIRLTFPDIEGCEAEGRSLFDALEEAREKLVIRLMSMQEANEKIPPAEDYLGKEYIPVRVIFAA